MRGTVLIVVVAGCMTTRTVRRTDLDAIASKPVRDGVVLRTTEVWKTRLDPASKIRLRNAAGHWSDWMDGAELHVRDGWLYRDGIVDVLDYATKIEIRGLSDAEREALAIARPAQDAELAVAADGGAVLIASGKPLRTWVTSFFEVVMASHPGDPKPCELAGVRTETDCRRQTAYEYVRYELRGAPLGAWTVHFPHREPLELASHTLFDRLELGLSTRYGWNLRDVRTAQVKSLSGALTLTAIVGVTAASIVLAPIALVARGGIFPGDGPRAPSSGSSGLNATSRLLSGGGGAASLPPGDWTPTLADASGRTAPRLFGFGARRKAMVQLVATAEASVDSRRGNQLVDGGAAVLRLGQAFELGAGGLHLASRRHGEISDTGLAFARIGVHLPIDAAHRVALPLSLDLGGGGGESFGLFMRLNWGARIVLRDTLFVGITPLTPTFINWKHDPVRRRGSVMSGVELGVSF